MYSPENYFTPFNESVDTSDLPQRFTFPFYYQPHKLCVLAVKELQKHLKTQTQWQHNFGITGNSDAAIGKMFGVLLVRNKNGEIGYLAAFSGKLADQNLLPNFVPPVFDMLKEDSFFIQGQSELSEISEQIKHLESNPKIKELEAALSIEIESSKKEIQVHRIKMIYGRKSRKEQRITSATVLNSLDFISLKERLSKQSIQDKNQLRDLKIYWDERIQLAQANLHAFTDEIDHLKDKRKNLSASLQEQLFQQYRFLNTHGVEKSLKEIFKDTPNQMPPAGAGECAAPKLLHHAYKWGMTPLAMAEFWWGASPKSEIRQHKNFYAACQSKCQPILKHMLDDIEMDENPLLNNPAEGKTIEVVYQDDDMVVINKPADFLSVPGKNIEDSVFTRMKISFPKATGPLIVHRLDMSTSGLMVIALNKESNKNLQKQFINRTVQKRYVALLDGIVEQEEGDISLPLRVDLDDRPRQLVCYEYGRPAETKWEVIAKTESQTKVYFYPKTGRTHQLRVHSAHINGLNIPIVGDDLYGKKSNRLHLHAELLTFNHPQTKESMHFHVDAEF